MIFPRCTQKIWPINKIISNSLEKQIQSDLRQSDLSLVNNRLEEMDYLDHKVLYNVRLISMENNGLLYRETIEHIFDDMKENIKRADSNVLVSKDVIERNKSVIRYFSDEVDQNKTSHMEFMVKNYDFMDYCPCGSGKEYFRCHL